MKKASTRQGKPIPFHKLHGAGNDIIVLEAKDLPKTGKARKLREMAHRHTGIGCDQFVEVLSRKPLCVQIWNGDGTKAEMCANGFRVLLFFAAQEGWISRSAKEIPVVVSGKLYLGFKTAQGYEVCLGEPKVEELQHLKLDGEKIPFHEVSVGNPHCVIFLGKEWSPPEFSLHTLGPKIEVHPHFPKKTNVEFIRSLELKGCQAKVRVDVWERGAGATLSCGSGAVAVAAVIQKLTGVARVNVWMTTFTLRIRFEGKRAFLSGPSALVAKGWYF